MKKKTLFLSFADAELASKCLKSHVKFVIKFNTTTHNLSYTVLLALIEEYCLWLLNLKQ